ncbi:MAG TPA: PQQ-dependent sugar dehydrogenase [Candidatus Sulfomarinibacteraceae bacterium]|nr:PQQ-dependent sugar dehydrogenase [Candidatus Sulfomarinibacteraceae bacterium]
MRVNRRTCLTILVIVIVVAVIGGIFAYRYVSQRVNVRPITGSGAVAEVELPPGFRANVFAEGLNGPRFMALGPDGVLHVADRGNGRIVALPDADGDGVADEMRVVADDLTAPHSLVYHEQEAAWFVGVPTGVVLLADEDGDGVAEQREMVIDDYPTGGHNTRTVEFLPDGRMVVSVGSSCNVCEEEDPRRATIVIYDGPDGSGERVYAGGLRNAVGLAIHPNTGELWASNNGRDLMGDDTPPETIYRVEDGADYGWPYCHSNHIVDPDLGFEGACEGVEAPVVEMQAHSAPLGLTFYDGDLFPPDYQGDLFIAFHGSWNRSVPTGYKVVRLPFEDGQPANEVVDFATGWLDRETNNAPGRPVDVVVGADGALYVSDDKGGFIYRIVYEG